MKLKIFKVFNRKILLELKKSRVISIIVIALIATLILYRLHTIEETQVVFSEDGLITGNGSSSYKDGVQGVGVKAERGFSVDLTESSRFVFVKFQEAYWRDEHLNSIAPKLPSKNYRILLSMGFSKTEMDRMAVGEALEIPSTTIAIVFIEADTSEFAGYALRTTILGLSGFSAGGYTLRVNITTPEPHHALYNEGHLTLTRTSGNTWTVDVEAWFALFQQRDHVKYYVRLSFRITISMKSLI